MINHMYYCGMYTIHTTHGNIASFFRRAVILTVRSKVFLTTVTLLFLMSVTN